MTWLSRCNTCTRPATRIISGRVPRQTYYAALSCDRCAPRHRQAAIRAGPVTEEPLTQQQAQTLF